MGKRVVNDVPAKYNAGFNPIEIVKRPITVINTSDKADESWLVVAVDMGEKFKVNNVACPTVVLPIAVCAAKLAEGESLFGEPKNGKIEVRDEGLLLSMDKSRLMRFEKS